MMKRAFCVVGVVAALTPALTPSWAFAACSASGSYVQLTATQIQALLVGNMACYPASAPFTNQEFLAGGQSGSISDYKKGPSNPTDPTKQIGTYTIDAEDAYSTGEINYNYGGSAYTYTVWGTTTATGSAYDFCVGSSPISIFVKPGTGGC